MGNACCGVGDEVAFGTPFDTCRPSLSTGGIKQLEWTCAAHLEILREFQKVPLSESEYVERVNAIHPADCAQHVMFGKCRCGTLACSQPTSHINNRSLSPTVDQRAPQMSCSSSWTMSTLFYSFLTLFLCTFGRYIDNDNKQLFPPLYCTAISSL